MKKKLITIILILLFFILKGITRDQDWPCWRGPEGNGISRETGWDPSCLKKGARVIWRAKVGQGHSALSIKDGLLYTQGSRIFKKEGNTLYEEMVVCLDARTGKKIWQFVYPCESMAHAGPRATPTLEGDRIYTLGSQGKLFCLDRKTGKLIWKRDLVSDKLSGTCKWGFSTSPLLAGKILLLNLGSAGLALDKTNGSVIWKSGLPSWGLASPVLVKIRGQEAVLLNTEYDLHAVKVSDGTILWSYPWAYCDADPVVVEQHIYVFGGKPGRKRCRALVRLQDGKEEKVWAQRKMNVAFQSWILFQGCVYGITWDKKRHRFQCFDLKAGAVKWEKRLKDWAAFSMAGGYIILLEASGDLVIIKASPESYEEISRASVFNMKRKSTDNQPLTCWTAPTFWKGKIYLRNTYGDVACVDARKM